MIVFSQLLSFYFVLFISFILFQFKGGGKFAVGIKFTKDFICRQNTMKQNYNYIVCLFVSRIWER